MATGPQAAAAATPSFSRRERLALQLVPVVLARTLFRARGVYPVRDGRLVVVSRVRSLVLAALVVGTIVQYDPSALWRFPGATVDSSSNAALVAIVLVLLSLVAGVLVAQGRWRLRALRAVCRPLVRIVGLLAFLFGGQALGLWTLGRDAPPLESSVSDDVTLNSVVLGLLQLVLAVWLVLFLAGVLFYVGRDLFALGDAHPQLLPVVSVVLAVVMLALETAARAGRPAPFLLEVDDPTVPGAISLAISCGAVVTATALSAWEFHLAGRQGYRLRTGEWR